MAACFVTSFAPQARRLMFARRSPPDYPSSIFLVSFVFLSSLLFCLISTVLWSGATSICDGIIQDCRGNFWLEGDKNLIWTFLWTNETQPSHPGSAAEDIFYCSMCTDDWYHLYANINNRGGEIEHEDRSALVSSVRSLAQSFPPSQVGIYGYIPTSSYFSFSMYQQICAIYSRDPVEL